MYRQCELWYTSSPLFYKCNVDTALFYGSCSFGVGRILCDENGKVLACAMNHFKGLSPDRECETITLVDAINWARDANLVNVIF